MLDQYCVPLPARSLLMLVCVLFPASATHLWLALRCPFLELGPFTQRLIRLGKQTESDMLGSTGSLENSL